MTPNHEENGPLFPGTGITLRDYFAAQAMIALHSSEQRGGRWTYESAKVCARNAYELADAMLQERDRK